MRNVLIVGATSAIAQATARLLAADGDRLFLIARDSNRLEAVAADLKTRGAAQVETCVMDVADHERHEPVIEQAVERLGALDTVLVAHGSLPDQAACETSVQRMREQIDINFLSAVCLLTHLANRFAAQGRGTIAVISSVAGDRGRQSNYVYGAAKGGLSVFLQGLRNRLHRDGVRVLTIKPGFVDTPMTAALEKGVLWASPETIARGIYKAIERGRDVAYLPGFWRPIMAAIRLIPESLFKRLRL
jgi:short-subunit dehydrogenase